MTRRILGIVSFLLAGIMAWAVAGTAWYVVPQMLHPSAKGGLQIFFLCLILFPVAGLVAAITNGLHLLRGSHQQSVFRHLLHASNGVFILLAILVTAVVWAFAAAYQYGDHASPLRFVLQLGIYLSPVIGLAGIYVTLLLWRGAVGEPPQR